MEKQKLSGYIMTGVGLAMIFVNAFNHIFNWGIKSSTSNTIFIFGVVFFVIGMGLSRKPSK
jgi:branched-subunit amino acid permease